ncbi:MAG: type II secretion system protein [bacterium]|nr:type II secretion system protein [bacterium]
MKKGYTLVELLVVISIITIFTAIVLPGFKRQRPEQALEQAALEIRSSILQARALALAPQNKYNGTDCFGLHFNPDKTTEIIRYKDGTSYSCETPIPEDDGTEGLKGYDKNLVFKLNNFPPAFTVQFRSAANQVYLPDGNTLTLETDNRKATLTVDEVTGYTDIKIIGI